MKTLEEIRELLNFEQGKEIQLMTAINDVNDLMRSGSGEATVSEVRALLDEIYSKIDELSLDALRELLVKTYGIEEVYKKFEESKKQEEKVAEVFAGMPEIPQRPEVDRPLSIEEKYAKWQEGLKTPDMQEVDLTKLSEEERNHFAEQILKQELAKANAVLDEYISAFEGKENALETLTSVKEVFSGEDEEINRAFKGQILELLEGSLIIYDVNSLNLFTMSLAPIFNDQGKQLSLQLNEESQKKLNGIKGLIGSSIVLQHPDLRKEDKVENMIDAISLELDSVARVEGISSYPMKKEVFEVFKSRVENFKRNALPVLKELDSENFADIMDCITFYSALEEKYTIGESGLSKISEDIKKTIFEAVDENLSYKDFLEKQLEALVIRKDADKLAKVVENLEEYAKLGITLSTELTENIFRVAIETKNPALIRALLDSSPEKREAEGKEPYFESAMNPKYEELYKTPMGMLYKISEGRIDISDYEFLVDKDNFAEIITLVEDNEKLRGSGIETRLMSYHGAARHYIEEVKINIEDTELFEEVVSKMLKKGDLNELEKKYMLDNFTTIQESIPYGMDISKYEEVFRGYVNEFLKECEDLNFKIDFFKYQEFIFNNRKEILSLCSNNTIAYRFSKLYMKVDTIKKDGGLEGDLADVIVDSILYLDFTKINELLNDDFKQKTLLLEVSHTNITNIDYSKEFKEEAIGKLKILVADLYKDLIENDKILEGGDLEKITSFVKSLKGKENYDFDVNVDQWGKIFDLAIESKDEKLYEAIMHSKNWWQFTYGYEEKLAQLENIHKDKEVPEMPQPPKKEIAQGVVREEEKGLESVKESEVIRGVGVVIDEAEMSEVKKVEPDVEVIEASFQPSVNKIIEDASSENLAPLTELVNSLKGREEQGFDVDVNQWGNIFDLAIETKDEKLYDAIMHSKNWWQFTYALHHKDEVAQLENTKVERIINEITDVSSPGAGFIYQAQKQEITSYLIDKINNGEELTEKEQQFTVKFLLENAELKPKVKEYINEKGFNESDIMNKVKGYSSYKDIEVSFEDDIDEKEQVVPDEIQKIVDEHKEEVDEFVGNNYKIPVKEEEIVEEKSELMGLGKEEIVEEKSELMGLGKEEIVEEKSELMGLGKEEIVEEKSELMGQGDQIVPPPIEPIVQKDVEEKSANLLQSILNNVKTAFLSHLPESSRMSIESKIQESSPSSVNGFKEIIKGELSEIADVMDRYIDDGEAEKIVEYSGKIDSAIEKEEQFIGKCEERIKIVENDSSAKEGSSGTNPYEGMNAEQAWKEYENALEKYKGDMRVYLEKNISDAEQRIKMLQKMQKDLHQVTDNLAYNAVTELIDEFLAKQAEIIGEKEQVKGSFVDKVSQPKEKEMETVYKPVAIAADGDCMFNSIIYTIKQLPEEQKPEIFKNGNEVAVADLRRLAADGIDINDEEHIKEIKEFFCVAHGSVRKNKDVRGFGENIRDVVFKMFKDVEDFDKLFEDNKDRLVGMYKETLQDEKLHMWGGDLELMTLSKALGVKIHVHAIFTNVNKLPDPAKIGNDELDSKEFGMGPEVHLHFNCNSHYNAIEVSQKEVEQGVGMYL